MQIRTKLSLQFLLLGGIIMIVASIAIYMSSAGFRRDDIYTRLKSKAVITAKMALLAKENDARGLREIKSEYPVNLRDERVVIINYLNDVIYSTDTANAIAIRYDVLERVRLYQTMFYRQGSFEVLGTLYTTPGYRYVVLAAAKDIEGMNHLHKLRIILIAVSVASLLLLYFAGIIFAGRALKPISNVIAKVEEISISRLDLRVPEGNGKDEIGKLAATFNKMLERLQVAFRAQKDFIANASHELRTPLTSIHGQLEVLTMKERSASEYNNTITSTLEDIRSLTELTNRLLLLARTSESQTIPGKALRIDEILWQIKDDLKKIKPSCSMSLSFDGIKDGDEMIVSGDEQLLKTAFLNISENAFKYSPDRKVEVVLRKSEEGVEVSFKDNGRGINKSELEKIMEPFYRSENAVGISGHGIGLSLVNQIIKMHGGSIRIFSEEGKGTSVIILLPAD